VSLVTLVALVAVSAPARAADAVRSTPRTADAVPCAQDRASARRIEGPGVDVAWRVVDGPIAVGRPFAIDLEVCPRGAHLPGIDRLRVDAWMPEHRHGMNYRPTLTGAPPGPVRAEGLLFHMPGRWQLVIELRADGRALRLVDELSVR
jgi:hypothetical protein